MKKTVFIDDSENSVNELSLWPTNLNLIYIEILNVESKDFECVTINLETAEDLLLELRNAINILKQDEQRMDKNTP